MNQNQQSVQSEKFWLHFVTGQEALPTVNALLDTAILALQGHDLQTKDPAVGSVASLLVMVQTALRVHEEQITKASA